MGRTSAIAAALAALLLAAALPLAAEVRIAVQPLGEVPAAWLQGVEKAVRRAFPAARLVRLPPAPLPADAWYPARRRYRAERLLFALEALRAGQFDHILGVTRVDISTTKEPWPDWGIFGLGALGGGPCVISSFRLQRGGPLPLLLQRLAKVAVHELGHTAGLPHCPTPRCVMEEYQGSLRTLDLSRIEFCRACRAFVDRAWRAP